MGISERKERERQEMRQRIIEASMAMFAEEGYEKTSIRNIAEKIEYSPATIYLYYKDKDELLYDVQKMAFEKLLEVFRTEATSRSPWKRLEQICTSYINFALKRQELYELMFIIKAPMNVVEEQKAWTNGEDAFGYLMMTVHECMEKGLISYKDADTAALSIWSMGHGLVSLHLCCRFKVLKLTDGEVEAIVHRSMGEYLRMIKAG